MEISYITAPIIGAVIGYSTNWIAIKMMFRPRKAIKIGKVKLPFTPGIIPKNKTNIAHAISSTITNNLLTEEDIKKILISDEIKSELKNFIDNKFQNIKDNSINEILEGTITKKNLNSLCDYILDKGTKSIFQNIKEKELAHIISEQIRDAVKEKTNGTIFAIFSSKKILDSLTRNVEDKINDYIDLNGEKIIYEMVEKELNKYLELKIDNLNLNIDISSIAITVYENLIINNFKNILNKINIEKIIEDKINEMDMKELEKLILKVMKKELNAVINLGALIGFILGLINILF